MIEETQGRYRMGTDGSDHDRGHSTPNDDRVVATSGLVDVAWYREQYADAGDSPRDALAHYCERGWREGRQPNPYFDPAWYAQTYASECAAGTNPLLHYIERGERENAWPSPHFDPEWYRDVHRLAEADSPLRHYLQHRFGGTASPLPSFDVRAHLATHPDLVERRVDPYLHSLRVADNRGRTPVPRWSDVLAEMGRSDVPASGQRAVQLDAVMAAVKRLLPWLPFDAEAYTRAYPDVAEALAHGVFESAQAHFVEHGFFEGRWPLPDTV